MLNQGSFGVEVRMFEIKSTGQQLIGYWNYILQYKLPKIGIELNILHFYCVQRRFPISWTRDDQATFWNVSCCDQRITVVSQCFPLTVTFTTSDHILIGKRSHVVVPKSGTLVHKDLMTTIRVELWSHLFGGKGVEELRHIHTSQLRCSYLFLEILFNQPAAVFLLRSSSTLSQCLTLLPPPFTF